MRKWAKRAAILLNGLMFAYMMLLWPMPIIASVFLRVIALAIGLLLAVVITWIFVRAPGRTVWEQTINGYTVSLNRWQVMGISAFVLGLGTALGLVFKVLADAR